MEQLKETLGGYQNITKKNIVHPLKKNQLNILYAYKVCIFKLYTAYVYSTHFFSPKCPPFLKVGYLKKKNNYNMVH
jgi:hypothetical protein